MEDTVDRPSELPDLPSWCPVAVDTETNGLHADDGARVSTVSVGWVDPGLLRGGSESDWLRAAATGHGVESRAFPFAQGPEGKPEAGGQLDLFAGADVNLPQTEWAGLLAWLAGRRLVFHHAKFDLEKMRVGVMPRPGIFDPAYVGGWAGTDLSHWLSWDTQLANSETWPLQTASLKPTAARLWGVDEKAEQKALKAYLGPKTDPRYDLVPWYAIRDYAAKDAELTIRLWLYQQVLKDQGAVWAWAVERKKRVCLTLYRIERAGVPYDPARSREIARSLRKTQAGIELPFRKTVQGAVEWFYGRPDGSGQRVGGRLVPAELTKTGEPSLTATVINRTIREHAGSQIGDVAAQWGAWSQIERAVGAWYDGYADACGDDHRLRTCYRQVSRGRGDDDGGTRSGRFSVERVNLQAIPQDYRLTGPLAGVESPRAIIGQAAADYDGWELWELDLAQAELRVAALWAHCKLMLEMIRAGEDLHGYTARQIFDQRRLDSEYPRLRQTSKRANFSAIFGVGWKTYQKMVEKETGERPGNSESERTIDDWNRLYPEFRRELEREARIAERRGYVELSNGRRSWFHAYERFSYHKAFNRRVQGSIAEHAQDWAVSTDQLMRDEKIDRRGVEAGIGYAGLLLLVHDSQVLLLPAGAEGERLRTRVVQNAKDLWAEHFDGVPCDVDCKRWK